MVLEIREAQSKEQRSRQPRNPAQASVCEWYEVI